MGRIVWIFLALVGLSFCTKANGNYAYIDNVLEAKKTLVPDSAAPCKRLPRMLRSSLSLTR